MQIAYFSILHMSSSDLHLEEESEKMSDEYFRPLREHSPTPNALCSEEKAQTSLL